MKKVFLSIFLTAIAMTSTACGTISPPVQTQTETAVTEPVESVTDSAASALHVRHISGRRQLTENLFGRLLRAQTQDTALHTLASWESFLCLRHQSTC